MAPGTMWSMPPLDFSNTELNRLMFNFDIDFFSPWYLVLLALVPIVWLLGFRPLIQLGPVRRWVVISLRSAVLVLLVLALADLQKVETNQRLTVMFLLDQSASIPTAERRTMVDYVNRAIKTQRHIENPEEPDRAGVIVFGRDAKIELPALEEYLPISAAMQSRFDPTYTNLAAAIRLAQASFPEDGAKRIVIVSDFKENLGNAIEQVHMLDEAGIGLDVVPVRYRVGADVSIEKVTVPSEVRRGQTFNLTVVLNNTAKATQEDSGIVKGRLKLTRTDRRGNTELLLEEEDQRIELPPGKSVMNVKLKIDKPEHYSYEAQFIADEHDREMGADSIRQNNRASAYTYVEGRGLVLLIEDHKLQGEHKLLVDRLQQKGLAVEVMTSDPKELFTDPTALYPYDTVILANVPRERFSNRQIKMLVHNTHAGSGLVMLGGENSFGSGGWNDTPIEEALPVDFHIDNAKVKVVGALALIMHACEMPQGNKWEKIVAQESIRMLGYHDYCGLLHYGGMTGRDSWLWKGGMLQVGVEGNRQMMLAKIDRMVPGDMPSFNPTMQMALNAFKNLRDAAVKHMIIISDGDPSPPSQSILNSLAKMGVKVTTVAIDTHGVVELKLMQKIARDTGGKFYHVKKASMLPRIYQNEVRKISRPLTYKKPVVPQVIMKTHEMVKGLDAELPQIDGFVMTTLKDNPLVEVQIVSPKPVGQNNTILASWTYGLGRAVAFTSDAGQHWTARWKTEEKRAAVYDRIFGQIIRWSMRPVNRSGEFNVRTKIVGEKVHLRVSARSDEGEFLDALNLGGNVVDPTMERTALKLRQTAPGTYETQFDAPKIGNYFLNLSSGPRGKRIRAAINIPYSAEFRDRGFNEALFQKLSGREPKGGDRGQIIEARAGTSGIEPLLEIDAFRHDLAKATSSQGIWHELVLMACCLFFFDVLIRRVNINFAWVPLLAGRIHSRIFSSKTEPAVVQTMERLRSRKASVSEAVEKRIAGSHFELEPDADVDTSVLDEHQRRTSATPPTQRADGAPSFEQELEEEDFTDRLLKAKKKVWKEREKEDR